MPWPLFNRPSIQLGTLKAYLENNTDWLQVDTAHPYLELASILGPELYHWISQNAWVSESLYAPLLFPEKRSSSEKLATIYANEAGAEIKKIFDFNIIHAQIKKHLENWVIGCEWSRYNIIGFSVCFHQLLASLAAASAIKKRFPHMKIVFGGSSCAAAAGKTLLDVFNCLDFIIQGEGERNLLELCAYISGHCDTLAPNIFSRSPELHSYSHCSAKANTQLPTLAALPVPDYRDYFAEQAKWFRDKPFIPLLPIEFSRGCWWNKCAFCNLNLQWCGYRYKKSSQVVAEISELSTRHNCLDFTFTDNMLPPQESLQFFSLTDELHRDFNFFAEIRPLQKKMTIGRIFSQYRQGGLSTIQVGVESLSNTLLEKMRKGVGVIETVATMRAAQEHSLHLEGNLITLFPGSTQDEVNETLENLEYVFPYTPLKVAAFFLGYKSPVADAPREFGIRAIVDHVNNRKLFPLEILKRLDLVIKGYRGDRQYQKDLWQPVVKKVKEWQAYHERRNLSTLHKPLLYFRDGGDFLLIRQELIDGTVLHHRLKDTSRKIYLFCTDIRSTEELFREFPYISHQGICAFLADLRKKRLIFEDKNRHLALAVHTKGS